MATPARQAWRQLIRTSSRSPATPSNLLQQQRLALRRQASTSTRAPSRRAVAPSPSALLRPQPSARRSYSSGPQGNQQTPPPPPPPPRSNGNQVKFWPFVIVIACGSGGYMLLVNRRKEIPPSQRATPPDMAPTKPTPAFSAADVTVLFVLGGPGAGKGTQCARLVHDYGFTHLSAGDLLRAEQDRPGSQYGQLIRDCIKNGAIVPQEVTIALLEQAMRAAMAAASANRRFLIDGFPRKMDQALKFEEVVCPARLVLFYDCPEAEMERRLMERGKTSGRADDNADSIRKRFRTFVDTSMPVVTHYEAGDRVVKIDATPTPDQVYAVTQQRLKQALGDKF
ncbi:UMP-CMP kinase [Trichocladium antarcticum]|uniref:Uridylate kinase n=1 Tax=Trichocladium antarcticum TaxID=1450529 RepID=A0AAN6UP92_9PEZI|nr:UMP-CMP kinase [Trichocladium antarcticum]